MKFIKLTTAIIIPVENIIEATALAEQDSDNRNTKIVVKHNDGIKSYFIEESLDDIYRMLEK